jgi:hypothetical protein
MLWACSPEKPSRMKRYFFRRIMTIIGINEPEDADRIYNGANDNASGTAAVLALAHYFSKKGDNARTLIFCAFSGEELGLLGSQAFVKAINPGMIKAVINIEMIGQTDAVGKNSFFVTGAPLSDMASILRKNLAGTGVTIKQEPRSGKTIVPAFGQLPLCQKRNTGTFYHVQRRRRRLLS